MLKPVDRKALLRGEYMARVSRVMDHVERNLDRPLRLEDLARVANFSPFHFHRIFHALAGETLAGFIRRVRLERAASKLTDNPKLSVTAVALDCGFPDSAAFARAFRERFGMSAMAWRSGGAEAALRARRRTGERAAADGERKDGQARRKPRQQLRKDPQEAGASSAYPGSASKSKPRRTDMIDRKSLNVAVKELPALRVAYITHIGPFPGVKDAFERLMRWAGPRGLLRFPETKMLAVYHDNPDVTDAGKLRSSACITVPESVKPEGEVNVMTIPGGLFAVGRFEIAPTQFGEAWDAFMGGWLPESGYQPDDRMCYEVYLNDPREHPQGKFIIDICEPIKPL